MLHIVTDGTADMPPAWPDEYAVHVLPINIHFGDQNYLQGIDLTDEAFYRLVDETGTAPRTSPPSPRQFEEFYHKLAKRGETVLSLPITSKLSGTFDSAAAAARTLAGEINIVPFDSGAGSAALDVKPIVALKDGVLEMTERVRTRSRALDRILSRFHRRFADDLVQVAVVHARDPQSAESLRERVQKMFTVQELITTDLSVSVAANLGPGTVGVVMYPVGEYNL